jgi:hypothetical protein
MKTLGMLAIVAVVSMWTVAARADSNNDPRIVIRDASCSKSCGVGDDFGFSLPPANNGAGTFTGTLSFKNDTQSTWYSLLLVVSNTDLSGPVSCGADAYFSSCLVRRDPSNSSLTEILFANLLSWCPAPGIIAGGIFDLDFSGVNGSPSWPGSQQFSGYANPSISQLLNPSVVPEPGTLALLLVGVGAIATRRKLWSRSAL